MNKKTFKEAEPELRTRLLWIQNELKDNPHFSVIILIAGMEGAGKGETVNTLYEWMDPRYLFAHAYDAPSPDESQRPPAWRFWRDLPPKGSIGIFFGSWYAEPIKRRVDRDSSRQEHEASIERINTMEKMLVEDGTLVLKFWFHLSKKAQRKRFKKLAKDPMQSWRVTEEDWEKHRQYDRIKKVSNGVRSKTNTPEAPWIIVDGVNKRRRSYTVAKTILDAITLRMEDEKKKAPDENTPSPRMASSPIPNHLGPLDLSKQLDATLYKVELERLQGQLNRLSREALASGVSTIVALEGWDAAGKGGAIRRMTAALDARYYDVVPIAAPSSEELARHYLWRFWRRLSPAGQFRIFDRTWYGRVLVERVEGFAREPEWRRAYEEINDFEAHLARHGVALVKCWLHIDQTEQLRRFQERERTPYKKHKITQDDYRNRAKWETYACAVNEMVERTSTPIAPWTLVEANDKPYARIKVLKTCCDALKAALRAQRGR